MIKLLLLFLSLNIYAMSKEEALELLEINKIFSKKEILNNYELCSFQNTLLKKLKKELLVCRKPDEVKSNNLKDVETHSNFIEKSRSKMNVYKTIIDQDYSY